MREATKEERDGIKRFIESISTPTGNNIFEKKRSKMIKISIFSNNKKLKEENKKLKTENEKLRKTLKTVRQNLQRTYRFSIEEYEPRNLTLINCIGCQYNYIRDLLYDLEIEEK